MVRYLLQFCVEKSNILYENPDLRHLLTNKLGIMFKSHISTIKNIHTQPDSKFVEALVSLSIPLSPFVQTIFKRLLLFSPGSDHNINIKKLKEYQHKYNSDLNDSNHLKNMLTQCCIYGSRIDVDYSVNKLISNNITLTTDNYNKMCFRTLEYAKRNKKLVISDVLQNIDAILAQDSEACLCDDLLDLLTEKRSEVSIRDIEEALSLVNKFGIINTDICVYALNMAVTRDDNYDFLCYVLNLIADNSNKHNIIIGDNIVMETAMDYLTMKGDVKVAIEIYQKLINSGYEPTMNMFQKLFAMFLEQNNFDMCDYILHNIEKSFDNTSYDTTMNNLLLKYYALKGQKDKLLDLKSKLGNNLTVESFNNILLYNWNDNGVYLTELLNEMSTLNIIPTSETCISIITTCKRFTLPNLTKWVLEQINRYEIIPSNELMA
eukprot:UN24470